MEKRETLSEILQILKWWHPYYEKYANKLDNLDEMMNSSSKTKVHSETT